MQRSSNGADTAECSNTAKKRSFAGVCGPPLRLPLLTLHLNSSIHSQERPFGEVGRKGDAHPRLASSRAGLRYPCIDRWPRWPRSAARVPTRTIYRFTAESASACRDICKSPRSRSENAAHRSSA